MGTRTRTNLLSGIARCGHCKGALSGAKNSTGGLIYKCKHYEMCKHGVTRLREKVDLYVQGRVIERLRLRLWMQATNDDAEKAREIHADIERQHTRIEQTKRDYDEDLIDARTRKTKIAKIEAELDVLATQLARVSRTQALEGLERYDDPEEWWGTLDLDRKRAVIEFLCDKIVLKHVGITGRAAAKLPLGHGVEVRWNQPEKD